jgi:hypothetical protein
MGLAVGQVTSAGHGPTVRAADVSLTRLALWSPDAVRSRSVPVAQRSPPFGVTLLEPLSF